MVDDPNLGTEAIANENAMLGVLMEREERIVSKMVTSYESGNLDVARLYGLVGQIAEVRQIERKLRRESTEAVIAAEESHG